MSNLNEKALEAADRTRWTTLGVMTTPSISTVIAAYFDSLAEQGIRLVDVREVVEWLRENGWVSADAVEARFAPEARCTFPSCRCSWSKRHGDCPRFRATTYADGHGDPGGYGGES